MESNIIDLGGFIAYILFAYTAQRIEDEAAMIWLILTGNYESKEI